MQAIITREMQNFCAIPEDCDAGLFVHSGQVQVRQAKISNDDCKIEQDQDGDTGQYTFNIPVRLQTLQQCESC